MSHENKTVSFNFQNEYGTFKADVHYRKGVDPVPLVVFQHGLAASKNYHKWLIPPFLQAGYVLAMYSIPNAIRDISIFTTGKFVAEKYIIGMTDCIDTLEKMEVLKGVADFNRIGIMGHSAGGMCVLNTAIEDVRVKAIVAMSPPTMRRMNGRDLSDILPIPEKLPVPVQIQVGSNEGYLYEAAVKYFKETLKASYKELVVIDGANHVAFLDEVMVKIFDIVSVFYKMSFLSDQPMNIKVKEAHRQSSQAFIRFFNKFLKSKG